MGLITRYRAWATDVPEGVMRRDWRLHPLRVARFYRFQTESGWARALNYSLRLCLGLPLARAHWSHVVPWGHRRYDRPMILGRS